MKEIGFKYTNEAIWALNFASFLPKVLVGDSGFFFQLDKKTLLMRKEWFISCGALPKCLTVNPVFEPQGL